MELDSAATTDFTKFGLEEGTWLGVGGQAPYNQVPAGQDFAASVPVLEEVQKPFYARISKIEALKLTFDLVSSGEQQTLVTSHTGSNFSNLRLFFPSVLRNTKTVNEIKYRQYQVERTLGKSDTAHTYQQSPEHNRRCTRIADRYEWCQLYREFVRPDTDDT